MRSVFFALLAAVSLCSVACGSPAVGESCDTVGSTSACTDGAVCDSVSSGTGNVCYKICTVDSPCLATENCTGVSSKPPASVGCD